ncbi:MAG: hypothetical protein HY910_15735 [Desulfarculus sp.]|nr:hypothetical protein [Desulfarculus sp.]
MTAAHSTKSLGRGYAAITFLAILVLLAVSWLPCSAGGHPDPVLWLTPGQDRFPVYPYLQFLEDPTGQLTIQDVTSPAYAERFRPWPDSLLRTGLTRSTFWLRLTLAGQDGAVGQPDYVFDLSQVTKVAATLYTSVKARDGKQEWLKVGPLSRTSQPMDHPSQFSHFPLPPPSKAPQTIFLRVKPSVSLEASPEITTRSGFEKRLLVQALLTGSALGLLAFLAASNLSIYFTLRYAGYLWYGVLLLTFCIYIGFLGGLFEAFAPQAWFSRRAGLPVAILGLLSLARLLFVKAFLPLKRHFPLGDRLITILLVCYLPLAGWPIMGPLPPTLLEVYTALTPVSVLVILLTGVICWRKGFAPATFFLSAYLCQVFGSLNMMLGNLGIGSPLPLPIYTVQQIALAAEAVLLSQALVQRFKALRQEREMLEQTAQREAQEHQRRLRSLAGELVRSEERQRKALADDLHDSVSQNLATSLFNLRLRASQAAGNEPAPPLGEICDLLRTTLEQTRTLTFDISPPVLHDYGLEAGLEWLAERFQERHGLEVSFQAQGALPGRDENLEVNLFRAAQELLVNAVKHSSAHKVEISLDCQGSQVVLRVNDDGQGMEAGRLARAGAEGFGLFSIRERLQALGGSVEIDSSPGQGTTVTLRAPWPQEPSPVARG